MRLTKLARIFGWIFVVVGVLGFIPGVTTNGMLLGTFHVNSAHNWFHIITGFVAFRMGRKDAKEARRFFQIVGLIYIAVAIAGFVSKSPMLFGMIASNMADTWLHLVAGVVLAYIGFFHKGK